MVTAAEKLAREAERLCRDVETLNARIEPIDDEIIKHRHQPELRRTWTTDDAVNVIEQCRAHIYNCEIDLNAIRGRINAIEGDVVSRAEMMSFPGLR